MSHVAQTSAHVLDKLSSHTRMRHGTIVIAEYSLFHRALLQKRLINLSIIVTLMSRVTLTNESHRTDKCAVDHTTIITHPNASCYSHHTLDCVVLLSSYYKVRHAAVITHSTTSYYCTHTLDCATLLSCLTIVTHMNASWEWIMALVGLSHGARRNESCHIDKCTVDCTAIIPLENASCHTCKWVVTHLRMSHATRRNESWHTDKSQSYYHTLECVMRLVTIATLMNESCPTHMNESCPTHMNESCPTHMNESCPTHMNESCPAHMNESRPTDMNESCPTHMNESRPTHVKESPHTQMNESWPHDSFIWVGRDLFVGHDSIIWVWQNGVTPRTEEIGLK